MLQHRPACYLYQRPSAIASLNDAMREITSHRVNECNEAITIESDEAASAGGTPRNYWMKLRRPTIKQLEAQIDSGRNPQDFSGGGLVFDLSFQDGPIKEVGTNGVTHEALLAIVIDWMQAFQKGPYACRENAIALTKLEEAMHCLQHRTRARVARGVEGTHEK